MGEIQVAEAAGSAHSGASACGVFRDTEGCPAPAAANGAGRGVHRKVSPNLNSHLSGELAKQSILRGFRQAGALIVCAIAFAVHDMVKLIVPGCS